VACSLEHVLEVIWEANTTAKMITADTANPKMAAIRGRTGSNVRWSSAFMGSSLLPYFLPIIDRCLLVGSYAYPMLAASDCHA
jgi:hypothetical protein